MGSLISFWLTTYLALGAATALGSASGRIPGVPYIPTDPSEVITVLPPDLFKTRRLATALESVKSPLEAAKAIRLLRESVQDPADPRLQGRIRAMLRPWMKDSGALPPEMLLEWAMSEQFFHNFDRALELLQFIPEASETFATAQLQMSSILVVLGRYDDAGAACSRINPRTQAVAHSMCQLTAQSFGISGQRGNPGEVLARGRGNVAAATAQADATMAVWILYSWADIALRAGSCNEAKQWLTESLRVNPHSTSAATLLADVLIDNGSPQEVLGLLERSETRPISLVLRAARAARLVSDPSQESLKAEVQEFYESETQAASRHERELAYAALHVLGDAEAGQRHAAMNFSIQREWIDARLVKDSGSNTTVQSWIEHTGSESSLSCKRGA